MTANEAFAEALASAIAGTAEYPDHVIEDWRKRISEVDPQKRILVVLGLCSRVRALTEEVERFRASAGKAVRGGEHGRQTLETRQRFTPLDPEAKKKADAARDALLKQAREAGFYAQHEAAERLARGEEAR